MGRSITDIKKLCPRSTLPDGLAVRGSDVKKAQDAVAGWLCELGLNKSRNGSDALMVDMQSFAREK
jgi:hypothetical protein